MGVDKVVVSQLAFVMPTASQYGLVDVCVYQSKRNNEVAVHLAG